MNGVDVDICSHPVILFLFVIGIKNPRAVFSQFYTMPLRRRRGRGKEGGLTLAVRILESRGDLQAAQ